MVCLVEGLLLFEFDFDVFCCLAILVIFVNCVVLLALKFDFLGLFCFLVCDFSLRGRLLWVFFLLFCYLFVHSVV